jgi:uncharacterized protein (DUF58 family)
MLLDLALLDRLERLQLATRRRLVGEFSGEHRSIRHGSSLDFADYREYHPGDDYRRIDYHLYARLDLLLLKLFEADDDLHVRLMVDTSTSMASDGKLDQAVRLAAALGFVALVRRDTVSLHTFPSRNLAQRFAGRHSTNALFKVLEGLQAGGETNFVRAATHTIARPGPAGVSIVISDLLTPEWEDGLRHLPARRGDVVVVHVLSRAELWPDLVGDMDLVDSETGARIPVSAHPDLLREYSDRAQQWCLDVATLCRHMGAGYVQVLSDEPIGPRLLAGWQRAGVLR